MRQRACVLALVAAVATLVLTPVNSFLLTAPQTASRSLTLPRLAAEFKGFGEAPKKPEPKPKSKAQLEREKYAKAYDEMASKGVPEYVVYIREKGEGDNEKPWQFVGSLAVPRTLKVDDVIFENEEGLVKGALKMYPDLKKVSQEQLQYGYNLKKFPDEPIKLAVRKTGGDNPVINWIERTISPLDPSGVGKKK